jgi:hypothetical protein
MHKYRMNIKVAGLALAVAFPALADDYASKNGWRFHNFKDPTFSWDIYRDTFIGIPPSEDPLSSAFDVIFYEQVYKSKLSADGNCFGMSLLDQMILKYGGHLGYCAPVTQYSGDPSATTQNGPTDPMLRRAINIMVGHQANLPTVQFLLNIFAQHLNRDAQYAYDQLNYWQSRGDLTLVCITRDLNPADDGHTMVAYRAQDLGGGSKKIFVLDPNRTWGSPTDQPWYNSESNFIQINNHGWSFDMGGSTWSGDPSSGGNLVILPISVTGPHSRSPASLGDTIIGQLLNTLLLTGDSPNIDQVTDAFGKRLYKPGTFELDTDPATGMVNTLPWFISDQRIRGQLNSVVLFHMGQSGDALRLSVRAGPGGYTLSSMGGRTAVVVTARGEARSDAISIRSPGTAETAVVLENPLGTAAYEVQFTRTEIPGQRVRVLTSSQLQSGEAGSVEVGLSNQAGGLQVSSASAALQYNLELASITHQGREVLAKSGVTQQSGTALTVYPRDWKNLRATDVLERTDVARKR